MLGDGGRGKGTEPVAGTTRLLSQLSGPLPLGPREKLGSRQLPVGSWTGRQQVSPSRRQAPASPRTARLSPKDKDGQGQAAAGRGVAVPEGNRRRESNAQSQARREGGGEISQNSGALGSESGGPQVAEKSCPRPPASALHPGIHKATQSSQFIGNYLDNTHAAVVQVRAGTRGVH